MRRIHEPRILITVTIHKITALVVSWSVLCCGVYSSQLTPCPSAEEGKSFALEYERRGPSHWELRLQTAGSTEEVKTCPESQTCDWGEFGQVSVTTRQVDNRDFSHINISRVTPSWRNKTLRCVVEHETNTTTRSAECKMDNYHKPESAQCEALRLDDNAIRFTCRTRRVYPELRCQVKQFGSKSVEEVLITDGFEYKNLPQPGGHYDSSCSVDVRNLRPGQYRYFGALIPAVNYKKYVRNMSVAVMPTSPIEISAVKPYVSILPHETVHVCMDTEKTVTLLCQAHKFESCPNFQWLLWDPASNTTSSLSQGAATNSTNVPDGTAYMSNYSTPVGRHHVGKHIVCSASSSNITAKHSVPVNVRLIPPPRALFTELDGRHLGSTLALNSGQRLTTICTVDADDKPYKFHVYCDRNNKMFPPEHGFGQKLIFDITGWGFDSTNCTCIVEDVCYNVNITLHITVVPSQNITTHRNNALLPDDAGRNVMLYVFIGTVVLLVLVSIISSLAVCFCGRGSPRGHNRTYSDDHVYEHVESDFYRISE